MRINDLRFKKIIIIFILSLFNFYYCTSEPAIKIEPQIYDFGSSNEDEIIEKEIIIYNNIDKKLNIKLQPLCDCLSANENNIQINPHDSKKILIKFNTKGYDGFIKRDMAVQADDHEQTVLYFKIKGFANRSENDYSYDEEEIDSIFTNKFDFNLLDDPGILHYFAYKNCKQCESVQKELVAWIKKQNHNKNRYIVMNFYQLEDSENIRYVYEISKKIGYYPELPLIVYNKIYYTGKKQILNFINNKSQTDTLNKNFFTQLNPVTIFLAGLIDGINPCAFTVIILLLSYLSIRFKNRIQTLLSGFCYIITVFITYYLVGIGIFETIRIAQIFKLVSYALKYGLTIFLFILAALSLYDYFKSKKNETDKMILKLPDFLQNSIRKNIRNQMKDYRIFLGSIILGFTISLFELACTGQVYFPIIGYMVRTSNRYLTSVLLLVLYNIAFIIPLTVIFIITFFGISSVKVGAFFRNQLTKVKLLFFILFIIFGIINLLV